MTAGLPLSTLLSQVVVAHTIELDNEFEHRFRAAGGGARVTSLTMWSNLLRFVGDGVTVRDLVAAVGLPRTSVHSRVGGVERWGYVTVGPPRTKREGYGSAKGLKEDWVVELTAAGRRAAEIWPVLPADIESRWRERFGADEIEVLGAALRTATDGGDVQMPEYLPVVSSANGMALELPQGEQRPDGDLALVVLLAHALMAYTLDFEEGSALSLPLSANVLRVLDADGVPVRELPSRTGISKEAVAVSLTSLARTEHVAVEGAPPSKKTIRLTPTGETLRADQDRLHARIGTRWDADLRASLERVLGDRELAAGLEPHADGWRATKRYLAHTEAMLADPRAALPHYPMVLHRGGWPDGS